MKTVSRVIVAAAVVAGIARPAAAGPEQGYREIRRAVFLNVYRARVDLRTTKELTQALAKLNPERFPESVRDRLMNDIEPLKQMKLKWLNTNQHAAAKWDAAERAKAPRPVRPFLAPLPPELALGADDKVPIDSSEVEGEINLIYGKLAGQEYQTLVLNDFIYHQVLRRVRSKADLLKEKGAGNPDLGFQVVRWAVFQRIGWIAGDEAALKVALARMGGIDATVKASQARVLAERKRIIRLRQEWLSDIVPKVQALADANSLTVSLPAELGLETAEGVVATEVTVTRAMSRELAYELEILNDPTAKLGDELPGGVRDKAVCLIRAGYIIDTLDSGSASK